MNGLWGREEQHSGWGWGKLLHIRKEKKSEDGGDFFFPFSVIVLGSGRERRDKPDSFSSLGCRNSILNKFSCSEGAESTWMTCQGSIAAFRVSPSPFQEVKKNKIVSPPPPHTHTRSFRLSAEQGA